MDSKNMILNYDHDQIVYSAFYYKNNYDLIVFVPVVEALEKFNNNFSDKFKFDTVHKGYQFFNGLIVNRVKETIATDNYSKLLLIVEEDPTCVATAVEYLVNSLLDDADEYDFYKNSALSHEDPEIEILETKFRPGDCFYLFDTSCLQSKHLRNLYIAQAYASAVFTKINLDSEQCMSLFSEFKKAALNSCQNCDSDSCGFIQLLIETRNPDNYDESDVFDDYNKAIMSVRNFISERIHYLHTKFPESWLVKYHDTDYRFVNNMLIKSKFAAPKNTVNIFELIIEKSTK